MAIRADRIAEAVEAALQAAVETPQRRLREHGAIRPVEPGTPAGIEHGAPDVDKAPAPGAVKLTCVDYSADTLEERTFDDVTALLAHPKPAWAKVRWINIDGLHPYVVNALREKFHFHTLAAEDVVHVPQRPRVESYQDHVFVVMRMFMLAGEMELVSEQVSMFLYQDLLITFQEDRFGDCWARPRKRLHVPDSRVREKGADFLLYCLVDAIVDEFFPIIERYGEALEELEAKLMTKPRPSLLQRTHHFKRELLILRRVMWPTRELVDSLQRDELPLITDSTRMYMRDVYTHAVQIIDIVDTHRELASGLAELYLSSISNRTNEIMKVLTIMSSIFIPITFFAGVYGMNFEHFPELKWSWAYPAFWVVCLIVSGSLLVFFHRKGWLGKS